MTDELNEKVDAALASRDCRKCGGIATCVELREGPETVVRVCAICGARVRKTSHAACASLTCVQCGAMAHSEASLWPDGWGRIDGIGLLCTVCRCEAIDCWVWAMANLGVAFAEVAEAARRAGHERAQSKRWHGWAVGDLKAERDKLLRRHEVLVLEIQEREHERDTLEDLLEEVHAETNRRRDRP